MAYLWLLNLVVLVASWRLSCAQTCSQVASLGAPRDRPSFDHMTTVEATTYQIADVGTKVAEVYAIGYAHCQSMVRYESDPSGSAGTYFSLNSNGANTDGVIRRIGGSLDDPSFRGQVFTLTIKAFYSFLPTSFSTVEVRITILQSNYAPTFPAGQTLSFTLFDDIEFGEHVYRYSFADTEDGPEGQFQIIADQTKPDKEIAGGASFSVNPATGDLYVSTEHTFLPGQSFTLTLLARDLGSPPLESDAATITISIVLKPIAPVWRQDKFYIETPERVATDDAPVAIPCANNGDFLNAGERFLLKVTAVDGNTESEADITYSIASVTTSHPSVPGKASFHIVDSLAANGNMTRGFVYMCGYPDREEVQEYVLTITATDTSGPLFTNAHLYVNVTDRNEPPRFLRTHYFGTISEWAHSGAVVMDQLEAVDDDLGANAALTYSIAAGEVSATDVHNNLVSLIDTRFTIDSETGVVRDNFLSINATYRYFTLTVQVTDGGSPSLSANTSVYLTIVDINNNQPTFSRPTYTFQRCENRAAADSLGMLTVADYDLISSHSTLTFFVQGHYSDQFLIPASSILTVYPQPDVEDEAITTAELIVSGVFDYETVKQVDVVVVAMDNSDNPLSGTTNIDLVICDDNDSPPVFEESDYYITMAEDQVPGFVLTRMRITDLDTLPNAVSTLSVNDARVEVNNSHSAQGLFEFRLLTAIDIEGLPTGNDCFDVVVTATNAPGTTCGVCPGTTLSDTATVHMCITDVNEHCPIFFPVVYTATTAENTPHGTVLLTVTATDLDRHSPNNVVNFFIVAATNDHILSVDKTSGEVAIDNPPDYEDFPAGTAAADRCHSMTVGVFDLGDKGGAYPNCTSQAVVTVCITNVNDNAPVCSECPYEGDIFEADPAGTAVVTVAATDADGDTITYTLTTDDSGGAFAVDGASGAVTRAATGTIDYETQTFHNLVITASDGTFSIPIHVTIQVLDSNDNCPIFDATNIPHGTTVRECPNGNRGGYVTTVTALDRDTDEHVTTRYSIASTTPPAGPFIVGPQSGEIHVSETGLDADGGTTLWTISIAAVDSGNAACSAAIDFTVVVTDCNDITPVIHITNLLGCPLEHSPVGTVVAAFDVSDGDLSAPNNVLTVELLQDTNGPPQGGVVPFALVAGVIVQYEIQFNTASIDREDPALLRISPSENAVFYPKIRVTDGGSPPLYSEYQFVIEVCDINDNCPVFVPTPPANGYRRTISENTPQDTTVIQFAAYDPDSAPNRVVVWSSTGCASFAIDAASGRFHSTADLVQGEVHTCAVLLSDGSALNGCPRTVTLIITISDHNNHCPVISIGTTTTSFPEHENFTSFVPQTVATITVTDMDLSVNTQLSLRIENPSGISNDHFPFTLSNGGPSTGNTLTSDLILRGPTDHEDVSRYDVILVATDIVHNDADHTFTCESSFSVEPIFITDLVDEPPMLSTHEIQGYVDENQGNTPVFLVPGIFASDLDDLHTPNTNPDTVTFTLVFPPATPALPFAVTTTEASDGLFVASISTTDPIDYELHRSFVFEIVATDSGGLTDTGTVTVTIGDLNDFTPECNATYLTQQGYAGSAVGATPGKVCTVTTVLCENATVDQRVLDLAFFDAFYDEDSGNNGDFYIDVQHYSVLGDTTPSPTTPSLNFQDDFGIRQQDILVLTQPLNYEEVYNENTGFEIYRLRVLARDQGTPQLTGTILVDVTVCDSNDNAPIFQDAETLRYIDEKLETLVFTLSVTDLDFGTNSMQEFSIIDVAPLAFRSEFSLRSVLSHSAGDHESTVELWTLPLDREVRDTYVVYIEAKDLGTPRLSATATVTIILNDINDNTPLWVDVPDSVIPCQPFTIDEELPLYTVIRSFTAVDADAGENARLAYSMVVMPTALQSSFAIGAADGEVRQSGTSLDYEDPAVAGTTFTITVTVTDHGAVPLTATSVFCFNIRNINDNPPVCPGSDYVCIDEFPFDVSATVPMIYGALDVFAKFPCTDADGNAGTDFNYVIGDDVDSALFVIDPADNMLKIKAGSEGFFDRETDEERHLTVVVDDRGFTGVANSTSVPLNHSIFITVCAGDVNDHAPMFDEVPLGCIRFAEGITNQPVVELVVRDPDGGGNGDLSITSFTQRDKNGTPVDVFNAMPLVRQPASAVWQPASAVWQVRIEPKVVLDRETMDRYTLGVEISDQGTDCLAPGLVMPGAPCKTPPVSLCVIVTDINDNSNNLTDIFFCVSEDPAKSVIGSTVYIVNVTDKDLGANAGIEYDIVNGTIDLPFSITRTTGEIRLAAPVDFETKTSYNLVISARDTGVFSQSEYANLTICVNNEPDTPPRFTENPEMTVLEGRNGVVVGTLADYVYDPDNLGEQIHFVLPDRSAFNDIISINQATGEVTVIKKLDRETRDTYTLTVGATNDHGAYTTLFLNTGTAYAQLTIRVLDVNDNTPTFENAFYLIAIDHQLEYGEEVDSVFATDIDLGDNAAVEYEFVHGLGHEPYFTINETTGAIASAGAFVWRTGERFEFMVRAYDHFKTPLELPQNDEGWRYMDVPITFYAAEEQTRVLIRINVAFTDVTTKDRTCVRNVLETVSHYMVYIDSVRHGADDSYYQVSPHITEFVIHAVHPNTLVVPHADELIRLLDTDQLADLLRVDCSLGLLEAGLVNPIRPIPTAYDRTDIYAGLLVGVVLGGFLILCCCLLCGCLFCWERRRRRTYQKKIASVSNLDQFSHSFFATKNPLFVPALGDATSESVESGSIADRDNILYASQELEVTLEDEPGEDEDWLKMDQPPEWLLPVEKEEYDDWTPPEKKPLLPPPASAPPIPQPKKVVHVKTEEVVKEKTEVTETKEVEVEKEENKDIVPVGFKRAKKEKPKEYVEQETFVEVFADVESGEGESDAELRLSALPSEDEDDVQVDADTFGEEAFQSTITSGDFNFDEDTPLIK